MMCLHFGSTAITSATEDSCYMYIILLYRREDLSGNTDLNEKRQLITATTIPEFYNCTTDDGDYAATLTGTPLQACVGENSVIVGSN